MKHVSQHNLLSVEECALVNAILVLNLLIAGYVYRVVYV